MTDHSFDASQGLYGSSREDLDHENHGYRSPEAFLSASYDVVTIYHYHDKMCVLPCHTLQGPTAEQVMVLLCQLFQMHY